MMKRFFLLAVVAVACGPAAQAQAVVAPKAKAGAPAAKPSAQGPAAAPLTASAEARANALTANMQQNLGLSPQQTEKVRVINQRGVGAVESARTRYRTDPRKLQGAIDGVGQARLEALKDVLTPAQFDKYQRKREEKMGIPNVQGVQGNQAPGLGSNE